MTYRVWSIRGFPNLLYSVDEGSKRHYIYFCPDCGRVWARTLILTSEEEIYPWPYEALRLKCAMCNNGIAEVVPSTKPGPPLDLPKELLAELLLSELTRRERLGIGLCQ